MPIKAPAHPISALVDSEVVRPSPDSSAHCSRPGTTQPSKLALPKDA